MINKISSKFKSTCLNICLIFFCVFLSAYPTYGMQMDSDINEENSLGIVIEESATIDNSKTSSAPDLGDDQTFPFIPGFGKNSGKDW